MKKRSKVMLFVVIAIILLVAGWLYFVKGYISVKGRNPVPLELIYKARVLGFDNVRVMVDPITVKRDKIREAIYDSGLIKAKFLNPNVNILSISGGGANGAYGAGIICGWTEAGNRPEFDIVTGVSTGALIAPAAFLGPSYDGVIKDIYTNITDADIAKQDFINFFLEGRPSLLDTKPLRHVLEGAVTERVINDVAREHEKGRRLYIATTNLDARRLVVWDMGAIAVRRTPEALKLFREVMLASAAIPVAFPPIMFNVEADGKLYDEMHVDGSVTTQILGALLVLGYDEIRKKKANVYVIRNGKFADVPDPVTFKMWDIAGAAFSTLITWQSYGDLYRFATMARYERIRFYFTCIPYEFNEPRKGEFDLVYMRKLFYRGYRIAQSGHYWLRQAGSRIEDGVAPGK